MVYIQDMMGEKRSAAGIERKRNGENKSGKVLVIVFA